MWKASRSASKALLVLALSLPCCAWAGEARAPAVTAVATPAQHVKAVPELAAVTAAAVAKPRAHKASHHSRRDHRHHRDVRSEGLEQEVKTAEQVPQVPAGAIEVSTRDLNRFVFAAPVVKGPIFPADAPVLGAPVYLDQNRQVLIQFGPGAGKPFQMVVELSGGQVESYLLAPRNIPGITFEASGIVPPRKTWKAPSGASVSDPQQPHQAEVTLLRSVVLGEIPDAFYPTHLPQGARFDKFAIVPRESWSDGAGRRILIYALVSAHGEAAVVAAPEFYHKGMSAILLTGEVVDASHSPMLYIIEGADRG